MLPADFPLKTIQVSAFEVFLSLITWAVMFRILPDWFRFMPRKKELRNKGFGWVDFEILSRAE